MKNLSNECDSSLMQTFWNEFTHSWLKKPSGQKRLNKEMSSPDTPSKASERFGGEPGLSCWIPSKLGNRVLQTLECLLHRDAESRVTPDLSEPQSVQVFVSSLFLLTVLTAVQADPAQRRDQRKSFVPYSWAREEKGAQFCHSGMGRA